MSNTENKSVTAEEIIDNIQREHSMGPYEYLFIVDVKRAMHDYAKLMIEKDRERIKATFKNTRPFTSMKEVIDKTPIILD